MSADVAVERLMILSIQPVQRALRLVWVTSVETRNGRPMPMRGFPSDEAVMEG